MESLALPNQCQFNLRMSMPLCSAAPHCLETSAVSVQTYIFNILRPTEEPEGLTRDRRDGFDKNSHDIRTKSISKTAKGQCHETIRQLSGTKFREMVILSNVTQTPEFETSTPRARYRSCANRGLKRHLFPGWNSEKIRQFLERIDRSPRRGAFID